VPIAQNADKSWSDLDRTQLSFELKNSKPVGVDEAGHSLVQTTLDNGSIFTLNTWDASYRYIPSAALNTHEAIDQFEISADGVSLPLNLNHLDLSDLDGVSPDLETQLADMATPIGEKPTGDLNHDNIEDKSQGGVVNIAWGTYQDFKAAKENTLTSAKNIINIVVAKEKANEIDNFAQLSHIAVLPSNSSVIGGSKPMQSDALLTPWDPITFAVDATTDAGLTDMFPNRAGLQTKVLIDISRAGEKFNAYMKYVSAQTIAFYNAAGNPLITLDGEKLTTASQAGWYDFTQRTRDGDGAHFVKDADGTIQQIEIILTDNAFGDDNPASDHFFDPAVPVIENPPPIFEEKTLESPTTVTALPIEFQNLILDESLIDQTVTKTEWIDNPLLCLPTWRQELLHIPAKIEQLVTTIEKFTAPLNGTGNALNNQITGNSAANILSGLAGKDILTGGAGADTFAYQNVSDSLSDAHDVITDFSALQDDKIDLSAVDADSNQAGKQLFHYIGDAAFTKQAAQLRFDSATHQLQGDTNGDGKAEFVIELSGISSLASDALILKT
ncbi:MAG: M10 family metallopeptidase C-terminal domain-containing protein, partial [Methylococcales bacterium]|nr:M10 family metallopeptidase C-terminal domain-containing protein [Methylococcales bacterium]